MTSGYREKFNLYLEGVHPLEILLSCQ